MPDVCLMRYIYDKIILRKSTPSTNSSFARLQVDSVHFFDLLLLFCIFHQVLYSSLCANLPYSKVNTKKD